MSREVCTTVDVGGEIEGHEVGGRRGRFEDRMSTHTVLVHVYSQPGQSYRNSGRSGVHIIMEVGRGGGECAWSGLGQYQEFPLTGY